MCGHSSLHHLRTSRNHQQETSTEVFGPDNTPTAVRVGTRPCPNCGNRVQEDFVFCPRCGTELLNACPGCHRAVEAGWSNCAYCGTDLVAE
ncbi:MAG: zinc ribbon domain-containing protein [Anaerolineales bacterium]|jgi:RNA polymerase subunit RPABC4/transcription elongation factor Spt4